MSSFHTFGDSHCWKGWESIKGVQIHWLPGKLCHSFGRDKLSLLNIRNYGVQEGDSVLFSFGEIDCRCHVHKYITETRSYRDVIDELVRNYFVAIDENVKQYSKLNVFVYFTPPGDVTLAHTEQEIRRFIDIKVGPMEETKFPWLGSNADRKSYYDYFYSKLKEHCDRYGYRMFDVYHKYSDDRGFLNSEYSDKTVHVKDPVFLLEELRALILTE